MSINYTQTGSNQANQWAQKKREMIEKAAEIKKQRKQNLANTGERALETNQTGMQSYQNEPQYKYDNYPQLTPQLKQSDNEQSNYRKKYPTNLKPSQLDYEEQRQQEELDQLNQVLSNKKFNQNQQPGYSNIHDRSGQQGYQQPYNYNPSSQTSDSRIQRPQKNTVNNDYNYQQQPQQANNYYQQYQQNYNQQPYYSQPNSAISLKSNQNQPLANKLNDEERQFIKSGNKMNANQNALRSNQNPNFIEERPNKVRSNQPIFNPQENPINIKNQNVYNNQDIPIRSQNQNNLNNQDIPIKGQMNLPKRIGQPQMKIDQPEMYPDTEEQLFECPQGCGRSFVKKALTKHSKICVKVFQKKRKQFNGQKQRIIDNEQALNIKRMDQIDQKYKAKLKKPNWKAKSEQFRSIVRNNQHAGPSSKQQMGGQQQIQYDDDLVQCKFCSRKFNEETAERHIPACQKRTREAALRNQNKASQKRR